VGRHSSAVRVAVVTQSWTSTARVGTPKRRAKKRNGVFRVSVTTTMTGRYRVKTRSAVRVVRVRAAARWNAEREWDGRG